MFGDQYPEFVLPLQPVNTPADRRPSDGQATGPRILIMRLAAFGDILMASPLLAALRSAYPSAHITWIVERHQCDTIIANPHIDEVILWDGRYWKRLLRRGLGPVWLASALRFRQELIEKRYDIFISLQPEEWPLLTRAVSAKKKIGIFDTFKRFNRDAPTSKTTALYSHAYVASDLPNHRSDQYLLVLKALGQSMDVQKQMHLGFTAEDQLMSREFLRSNGRVSGVPLVVIAPMATWPSRCWPAERYVELANRLSDKGAQIVLIGSQKEQELVRQVAAELKRPPMVSDGNMSFRQIAALISEASLVISGDTGPMHAAAALSIPYVAIFGSTSPQWYGPLSGKGICLSQPVPCGPCDQKQCPLTDSSKLLCLNLISVEQVMESASKMLDVQCRR